MATSTTLPLSTNKTLSSSFTSSSFIAKPSQLFLHGRRSQSFKVSCNANNSGEHDKNLDAVDRRNVLLGLGGLYGAANVAPLAIASPIPPPDLKSCSKAHINETEEVSYSCCPPKPEDMDSVPYYKFPSMTKLRIRPPAHAADEEYIAKYQLATSRMRELDKDPFDPLGFKQQANIHCAYCNGAYKVGGKELQVHFSWLFFPFHRWYLYFYERILGSLIGDPTFGLPYWNWDHPKGMRLPPMFDREGSSLYDEKRNQSHRNGTIIDLGHFGDEVQTTQLQMMTNNLTLMYRQMITNAPCPLLFFGAPYPLGTDPSPGMGTIENIPHTPVHIWTGDNPRQPHGENMGNFYSAGLDPVFYCHHANVDRMWSEWKATGGKRRDLSNKDWLNSEFFFYDENRNPYKVKVRDCLDTKKMGYDYAPMPTPWRNFKPIRKTTTGKVNTASLPPASKVFPLAKLDRAISFSINRPASSRTQQEKNEQEEMLTFNKIQYDDRQYVRFDVFLNVDKTVNADELDKAEFAGSYTSLPHVHGDNTTHVTSVTLQLAITELLEDIGLEDEDTIAVTLIPKKGGEGISIEGAEINLVDC
ncbi:Polyphenol oxidase F, chloroplastic [Capsicum annuum]|uniref:catechol oxidase n=1 Tax=Capsicum annuum TaxID=4072 RepID=A0A2G3AGD2_CAPAN|nr:catechol oxidase B, chloroplastic [Capsicum annuum]KAF3643919.1 Polyphenol oxidase F, chloroplastic [Capsicum annuum]KAF3653230.1 Polyphenol oxidase F, chloroplastic [Capsicum annuum]PHT93296.1 Polyphenol oxidase F, chloroplastic [Capsicum annuum]